VDLPYHYLSSCTNRELLIAIGDSCLTIAVPATIAMPAMSGAIAVNSALRALQPALSVSRPAPPEGQPEVPIRIYPRSHPNRPA
jgi:hypothetical protein